MTSTHIKTIEMPTLTWIDPWGEIKASEERRCEIEQQMRTFYEKEVDEIIGQWDMTLLGNGEIIGDIDGKWRGQDLEESELIWESIMEAIGAIDFSDSEKFDSWVEDGE